MNPSEWTREINHRFASVIIKMIEGPPLTVFIKPEAIVEVCHFLRDDPRFLCRSLLSLTSIDRPPELMEMVYHIYSMEHHAMVILRAALDRESPEIASLSAVWRTADWHERETYDLFGVRFTGHPDLRRILLSEDWTEYPLRKDFASPKMVRKPDWEAGNTDDGSLIS